MSHAEVGRAGSGNWVMGHEQCWGAGGAEQWTEKGRQQEAQEEDCPPAATAGWATPGFSGQPATLFNKREVLFLLQRPPGLGSPPDSVSWPQEDSMTGSLVGERNIKVG